MEELQLRCPLCCDQVFNSKSFLIEHLSRFKGNFSCPLCIEKFDSISALIQHIRDDCYVVTKFEEEPLHENVQEISVNDGIDNNIVQSSPHGSLNDSDDDSADTRKAECEENQINYDSTIEEVIQYNKGITLRNTDIKKDQDVNACLNFTEQGAENQYVVVNSQDNPIFSNDSLPLLTKQGTDVTISIQDVEDANNDIKVSSEMQEFYSCNTCGVSFTSVIEHIQNYHNDQDVVVEVSDVVDPADEIRDQGTLTVAFLNENESDQQNEVNFSTSPRITETASTHQNTENGTSTMTANMKTALQTMLEEEIVDKKGRLYTRRFVQIDKFWDKNETDSTKNAVNSTAVGADQNGKVPHQTVRYSCPHCLVNYDNSKSLCAHMKAHKLKPVLVKTLSEKLTEKHDPPSNLCVQFKCNVCDTIFPTNKSLRLHRRMHDPIKARPIDPPVHFIAEETRNSTDTFHCTDCNKWIHVGYRTVHQNFHRSTVQHNCGICNRKFHSRDYLDMHMTVHNTEKEPVSISDKSLPYTCLYCNRKFARPHEKVKHERIHTGEKPHSCEICGKSFRVSYCLTLHMRTHTGVRPYACQHCGKRFKAHSVYNHHMLTHSEVRAYKCPYCPKAFKTSVQLAGHKNSHTKPFSCTQCNRPFASLYAVRVHTETHRRQNNLKFACSLCGASYARAFALKDHMRQLHNQEENTTEMTIDEFKETDVKMIVPD